MIGWSLNYYNSIFVTVHKQKHDYIRIITSIRPVQSQFVSSIMRYPWIRRIYIHTHKFRIIGSTWARILSILDRYAQLYALISKLACVRTILIYHYYHVYKGKSTRYYIIEKFLTLQKKCDETNRKLIEILNLYSNISFQENGISLLEYR